MKKHAHHLDRLTALTLAVVLFVGCCLFFDASHPIGDDFAAYILEGKAIAEGTLEKQTQVNRFLHFGVRYDPEVPEASELVYVWGYPLLLSIVYRLVGYDLDQPQLIYYYKIPSFLCFALFTAVLFLFYRKRFPYAVSLLLTVCMSFSLFPEAGLIQTDIPFLFLTFLSFWLYEVFRDTGRPRKKAKLAVLLGAAMWYTVETRLNGFTVLAIIALQQVLWLWKHRPKKKEIPLHLLPWLSMLALVGISACFLPFATSNSSDVGQGSLLRGLKFYYNLIGGWILELVPHSLAVVLNYLYVGLLVLFVIGFLVRGFRSEFGYALFLAGTILVNAMLPYEQGLRYVFNILPLILMFMAWGAFFLYDTARRLFRSPLWKKSVTVAACVLLVLFSGLKLHSIYSTIPWLYQEQERKAALAWENIYTDSCLEAFRFVRDNTAPEAVISFIKPTALYLNTGRMACSPGTKGLQPEEADYYMEFAVWHGKHVPEETLAEMTPVFSNEGIHIYKVNHS